MHMHINVAVVNK